MFDTLKHSLINGSTLTQSDWEVTYKRHSMYLVLDFYLYVEKIPGNLSFDEVMSKVVGLGLEGKLMYGIVCKMLKSMKNTAWFLVLEIKLLENWI